MNMLIIGFVLCLDSCHFRDGLLNGVLKSLLVIWQRFCAMQVRRSER